jgi:hypothetical protein
VAKFGNPDGTFRDVTYEDTKELPLMDACIRETLRMVSDSSTSASPTLELTVIQHAPIQ